MHLLMNHSVPGVNGAISPAPSSWAITSGRHRKAYLPSSSIMEPGGRAPRRRSGFGRTCRRAGSGTGRLTQRLWTREPAISMAEPAQRHSCRRRALQRNRRASPHRNNEIGKGLAAAVVLPGTVVRVSFQPCEGCLPEQIRQCLAQDLVGPVQTPVLRSSALSQSAKLVAFATIDLDLL